MLRRWDIHGILPAPQVARALDELESWPLHMAQTKGLLRDAWALRQNVTVPDAVYVSLATHLNAPLLTDDLRLARSPAVTVQVLQL